MGMIGYKAFESDWTCLGFQYEIGKTYALPEGEKLEMCKCGFHFCANPIDVFGYYPMQKGTLVARVEALGEIKKEGTKFCTDKIKIVSEITLEEIFELIRYYGRYNSGRHNSGEFNSGDFNSGNYNSGRSNSGRRNSGHCNSGNHNSGHCNSGNHNTGSYNSGRHNSGEFNSGDFNSGNYNSGHYNSGHYNSGDYNSGDCNSGNFSSGYYNSGNFNSGLFNSEEPFMRAFNRETSVKFTDFVNNLDYNFRELCERIFEKALISGDAERIKALPNYDPDIFEKITGLRID